ncbi:hypothetical protein Tco_0376427, partial [Tanacetum coccineum]
ADSSVSNAYVSPAEGIGSTTGIAEELAGARKRIFTKGRKTKPKRTKTSTETKRAEKSKAGVNQKKKMQT